MKLFIQQYIKYYIRIPYFGQWLEYGTIVVILRENELKL